MDESFKIRQQRHTRAHTHIHNKRLISILEQHETDEELKKLNGDIKTSYSKN